MLRKKLIIGTKKTDYSQRCRQNGILGKASNLTLAFCSIVIGQLLLEYKIFTISG